jgi:hypothetical protein
MARGHRNVSSLRIEGGLLSPSLVDRLLSERGAVEGSRPEDYHVDGSLGEAITRSWNRMIVAWDRFAAGRSAMAEPTAADTRDRLLLPLFEELKFGRLPYVGGIEVDGRRVPISHLWGNVPIHLVGADTDLDRKSAGVAGAARMSPHSLLQDFLNHSEEHLWGVLANGLRLRILRDNRSITRVPYVEFDLSAIFEGRRYSDFVALWLMAHQSRFEGVKPEECLLENWVAQGSEEGTRALETLRQGVERAVETLGAGFLEAPANEAVRTALKAGEFQVDEFYRRLLRLVYRLIFLMVAEDRGVLLAPGAPEEASERYRRYFSLTHLRDLAQEIRGGEQGDLYRSLSFVMGRLHEEGCAEMALPALGSSLWDPESLEPLHSAELSNSYLLKALRQLAFTEESGALWRTDYRNLGSEELGSVYESLLELHAELDGGGGFHLRSEAGSERKVTGSYYTPSSLVEELLDSALEPVVDAAITGKQADEAQKALLSLRVCDPATGSGHFLVAAAGRMGKRLASLRTGEPEPGPEPVREGVRDVISRCIYGVDINPMAVELCKVSLWMEALEPGRPLSFLDHHIKVGNSLIGATPERIAEGVPDEAFAELTLDQKDIVTSLKKRNREERRGEQSLFTQGEDWSGRVEFVKKAAQLTTLSEETLKGVREIERRYLAMLESDDYRHEVALANTWCAAFFWPKRSGAPPAVTQDVLRRMAAEPQNVPQATRQEINRLATEYRFFHWHLGFPEAFAGPEEARGFDVVLGNPPWERTKLQEKEFFASRDPSIAAAPNAAARKKMIGRLKTGDPQLYEEFVAAQRRAEGVGHFLHNSGVYPLCGRGDINLYSVFAEKDRSLLNRRGRMGVVVPSGIATDDTTKEYFADLVDRRSLVSLFDFENRKKIFPSVDSRMKYSLLTVTGAPQPEGTPARFVFFAHGVADVREPERQIELTPEDFARINPNTKTAPIFRTRRDAEITKAIYRRIPVLIDETREDGNPWGISFLRMFDMSNDSNLFHTREQLESAGYVLEGNVFVREDSAGAGDAAGGGAAGGSGGGLRRYLPLYEAKMAGIYDHRVADVVKNEKVQNRQQQPRYLTDEEKADPNRLAIPYFWVSEDEVEKRLAGKWDRRWMIGWRDITSATNERTVLCSTVPRAGAGDTFLQLHPAVDSQTALLLVGALNSYCLDFAARQKIGGVHMKYHTFKQLPIPVPESTSIRCAWDVDRTVNDWVAVRVLELSATASDLAQLSMDVTGSPMVFVWQVRRRYLIKSELHASFFHLYGISRDDVDYIMETFPIVKRHDEERYGEYRTKRVILEMYDAMAEAIRTGVPYRSPIEPPPGEGDRV